MIWLRRYERKTDHLVRTDLVWVQVSTAQIEINATEDDSYGWETLRSRRGLKRCRVYSRLPTEIVAVKTVISNSVNAKRICPVPECDSVILSVVIVNYFSISAETKNRSHTLSCFIASLNNSRSSSSSNSGPITYSLRYSYYTPLPWRSVEDTLISTFSYSFLPSPDLPGVQCRVLHPLPHQTVSFLLHKLFISFVISKTHTFSPLCGHFIPSSSTYQTPLKFTCQLFQLSRTSPCSSVGLIIISSWISSWLFYCLIEENISSCKPVFLLTRIRFIGFNYLVVWEVMLG